MEDRGGSNGCGGCMGYDRAALAGEIGFGWFWVVEGVAIEPVSFNRGCRSSLGSGSCMKVEQYHSRNPIEF